MNGTFVNKKIERSVLHLKSEHARRSQFRFLLAVSGGPDSQCLLKAFPHVLRRVLPDASLIAVGVDHGLRDGANRELDLAERLANEQQVPFTRVHLGMTARSNIMSAAREARYKALEEIGGDNACVVTAHHFDDRAETVLIRLLRGKRLGSMAVLPEVSASAGGWRFRPMLSVRREEIDAYLSRWGVPYAVDPSNVNPRFLRSRVRTELLPLLESMSPRIRERLNEMADELLERPEDGQMGGDPEHLPPTVGEER